MNLEVASDLHLDFGDITLKNEGADVLILAGDVLIANDMHEHLSPEVPYTPHEVTRLGTRQANANRFRGFLDRVTQEFAHVVVVAGNHEFYDGKWVASLTHLRTEYSYYPNVYFLERDMVTLGPMEDNVTFVGGTLWADANKYDPLTLHALKDMMQDFSLIRNDELGYTRLKPATMCQRHKQTLDYFRAVLDDRKNQKCVVVGHHAPSEMSVAPWYKSRFLMNGGYRSDLSEFILDRPQIKLWVHGHTHELFDYEMGDTRIVCNPRGYIGYEASAYNFKLKFVEV